MKKIFGYAAAAFAACLLLFLVSIPPAGAFVEPDTGITKCYNSAGVEIFPCPGPTDPYYGQDGNQVDNGMSYSTSADNTTITDNVTHLVWQKDADDITRTWADANSYCSGLTLGGLTGWRLPELVELQSIMDLSVDTSNGAPAVNPLFTGTKADVYWTSTPDADSTANAWILNFSTTEDDVADKATPHYTLCVWEAAQ